MTETIYTPPATLEAEFKRIETSWFWITFMKHIRAEADLHMKLTLGHAGGPEVQLRVAAAMASAFNTVLDIPEQIRQGTRLLPGQRISKPPARREANDRTNDQTHGDEDAPEER